MALLHSRRAIVRRKSNQLADDNNGVVVTCQSRRQWLVINRTFSFNLRWTTYGHPDGLVCWVRCWPVHIPPYNSVSSFHWRYTSAAKMEPAEPPALEWISAHAYAHIHVVYSTLLIIVLSNSIWVSTSLYVEWVRPIDNNPGWGEWWGDAISRGRISDLGTAVLLCWMNLLYKARE